MCVNTLRLSAVKQDGDDEEETDLSDMDEENADATSSKQMKKKRQVRIALS